MSRNRKAMCSEWRCDWHGDAGEILQAPDPFSDGDTIEACPECRVIGSVVMACDANDCWLQATCGTPTDDGYRNTCGKHKPKA